MTINLAYFSAVSTDLQTSFADAAKRQHRNAGDALNDLLREYVERAPQAALVKPSITSEEQHRRQKAVTFARASGELEGFKVNATESQRDQQFVMGEITLAEYVKPDISPTLGR